MIKKTLYVFRRDLRIEDNTALIAAHTQAEKVITCFILDPRQTGPKNTYRTSNGLQFMRESLEDLQKQLLSAGGKLILYTGIPEKIIPQILKKNNIEALFFNADYTPFSKARDAKIINACKKINIPVYTFQDSVLINPEQVKTQQKGFYKVFTAFYNAAQKIPIPPPKKITFKHLHKISSSKSLKFLKKYNNTRIKAQGGSTQAEKLLKSIKKYHTYAKTRDFPALDTTNLSAHIKYGTVSIRKIYHTIAHTLGKSHPLIRQLYWHDFFTYIAYHNPSVFKKAFNQKYTHILWSNNKKLFNHWCTGTTGFPIVDAGMRELNITGFMHNRVRMITGSFLVKDAHINWQWGEKYFAQKLTDYDPAVNNGNWQWVASTGADSQPYFRIFNPWLQQKKFDPLCEYILKWIPELQAVPIKDIHHWNMQYKKYPHINYPAPILDHSAQAKIAISKYRQFSQ